MSQTRRLWGVDKGMKSLRRLSGSNFSSQDLHERKNLGTPWSAHWSFPSTSCLRGNFAILFKGGTLLAINPALILVAAVVIAAWLVLAIGKVVGVRRRQASPVAKKGSGSNFWKGFGIGILAILSIWILIGVVGSSVCESPPSVVTSDATEITANQATLIGELPSLGDAPSVDVSFQWGTSSGSYPNETEVEARETTGAFSFHLTGLNSNTTYYYRAKAVSNPIEYGTRYGIEKSFHTP